MSTKNLVSKACLKAVSLINIIFFTSLVVYSSDTMAQVFPTNIEICNIVDCNTIKGSAGANIYEAIDLYAPGVHLTAFDQQSNDLHQISFLRSDQLGRFLDSEPVVVASFKSNTSFSRISSAFDGRNFFLVWEDYSNGFSEIKGAIISCDGSVRSISTLSFGEIGENPSVVFSEGFFFLVYSSFNNDSTNLVSLKMGSDTEVISKNILSSKKSLDGFYTKISPANGGFYLATESFDNEKNISSVSLNFVSASTHSLSFLYDSKLEDVFSPNVAVGSSTVLFTFISFDNQIKGVLLDKEKNSPISEPFVLAETDAPVLLAPSLIFNGKSYIATWNQFDYNNADGLVAIKGVYLGESADHLGKSFDIGYSSNEDASVSLSFDGNRVFASWAMEDSIHFGFVP